MRKESDRSSARPGNDGNEEDAGDNGALDPVHHKQDCQEAATEDADPQGRVPHFVRFVAEAGYFVEVLLLAARKFNWGRCGTLDEANTSRVGQTDNSEVQADANTSGKLDTSRDRSGRGRSAHVFLKVA